MHGCQFGSEALTGPVTKPKRPYQRVGTTRQLRLDVTYRRESSVHVDGAHAFWGVIQIQSKLAAVPSNEAVIAKSRSSIR